MSRHLSKYKPDKLKNILIPCLIGNALEFYDFTLCGVFIVLLSKYFFPSSSESASLMGGMFAFSAVFWTRPLGALFFGYIGDKFGRKKALGFSILFMGVPTLIIACLPTYATIGIAAPCILLLCRLMQGLCTGGEYNGAAIFALEHIKENPGLTSGLISASCVVGAASATLVAYVVTTYIPYERAWRLAFLLGTAVAIVGYVIRNRTLETQAFMNKAPIKMLPIIEVIRRHFKQYLLAILTGAFNGILSYSLFGFLSIYLTQYIGVESNPILLYNIYGLAAFMISCPIFGHIADKIKVQRAMTLATIVATASCWLGFVVLQKGNYQSVIIGQLWIGIGVGSFVGPSHAFLQQQFATEVRYTGIASGFSLGMAITGGSTALMMTYVLEGTKQLMAPSIYITIAACVIWLSVLTFARNGKIMRSSTNKIQPNHRVFP